MEVKVGRSAAGENSGGERERKTGEAGKTRGEGARGVFGRRKRGRVQERELRGKNGKLVAKEMRRIFSV